MTRCLLRGNTDGFFFNRQCRRFCGWCKPSAPPLPTSWPTCSAAASRFSRQFAEDEQPVLPINQPPPGGRVVPTNSSAARWGLTNSPFYPSTESPPGGRAVPTNSSATRWGLRTARFTRQPEPRPAGGQCRQTHRQRDGTFSIAYRYGGTSNSARADRSGFMQHIFKRAMGINLPRDVGRTGADRTPIARSEVQPGEQDVTRTKYNSLFPNVRTLYRQQPRCIHAPHAGKISKSPAWATNIGQPSRSPYRVKKRPVRFELISGIRSEYAKCPNGTMMTDEIVSLCRKGQVMSKMAGLYRTAQTRLKTRCWWSCGETSVARLPARADWRVWKNPCHAKVKTRRLRTAGLSGCRFLRLGKASTFQTAYLTLWLNS